MTYAEPVAVKGDEVTWRVKVKRVDPWQTTTHPPQGGSGVPVKLPPLQAWFMRHGYTADKAEKMARAFKAGE